MELVAEDAIRPAQAADAVTIELARGAIVGVATAAARDEFAMRAWHTNIFLARAYRRWNPGDKAKSALFTTF